MFRSLYLSLFSVAALLLSFPLTGIGAPEAQGTPQKVIEAAVKGLPSFLRAIPPGELAHFNFASPQETERTDLGRPFQIHTITPQDILNYDGSSTVSDLVRPTAVWLVPILVDGRTRTLLTVEKVDGVWTAVAIGASNLAQEWGSLEGLYPRQEGYDMTFVRVYQATSDFVLLDQSRDGVSMIAMRSAAMVLGIPQGQAYAPENVVMELRETVRKNLELDRAYQ